MKIISTRIHGVIDYLVGLALIFAPNIFGFEDVGGAAVAIPRFLGIVIIISSLLTKYELSIAKIIPMPVHLSIDFLGALLLLASPFLFGFGDQNLNVWLPHIVVAIMEIVIVLMTHTESHEHHYHN